MKVLITNTAALNTGDAAILIGTIAILRDAFGPDVEFAICDQQPEDARHFYPEFAFRPLLFDQVTRWLGDGHGAKLGILLLIAVALLWRTPARPLAARLLPPPIRATMAEVATADLVVSAGGTYLVPHYRYLPKVLEMLAALVLGRPLVLFTQSIGPLPPRRQHIVRYVLRRARLILVRDTLSRAHLRAIGVADARIVECADAAFALAAEPRAPQSEHPVPNKRLQVAVSVRNWPHFQHGYDHNMNRYLDAVAAAVDTLVERYGAEVTFLSTCQGVGAYWTDDAATADDVLRRLPDETRAHVTVDREFHRPQELVRLLAGFDAVIATRMHLAILALCAGIPVLPIAYEFKTTELFAALGLSAYVADIDTVDGEELCRMLECFMAARHKLRCTLTERIEEQRRSAVFAGRWTRRALAEAA